MKYERMTSEEMLLYVKRMDENELKLKDARSRILQEIKEMQQRKEILSWDDIASAIAYPKAMSDKEHVSGGTPDEFKLLHQAERINRIFISQMEELFEELERTELQLTQHKYINRCISRLEKEDREIIDQFVRKDMTFEKGMTEFHMARSTLYKLQKKAIENLTVIYNE